MKSRFKNKKQFILAILMLLVLVLSNFSFLSAKVQASSDEDEVKDDIDDISKKIEKEQAAKSALEAELAKIQSSVYSTQEQIDKVRALIKESEENIARMEKEVDQMVDKIDLQKEFLKNLLQEVYYQRKSPVVSSAVLSDDFSQVFGVVDSYLTMEEKIMQIAQQIRDTKEKIEAEQEEIAEAKEEHEKILAVKVDQQHELLADRAETQGDIAEKEASISELQEKMAELKADLNRILGKSYDTGEIKDAIKFANKKTGVSKGYLFGMLSMESGGNPLAGACTYKNAGMSDSRKEYFKDIVDELNDEGDKDYDYKKMPVSCASKSYPGSGGAMGAAQFMSDTWWKRKSAIASTTGHNPPDPWNLLDGVVAMALYLEELGATNDGKVSIKNPCTGKSVKVDWEIYASMRYLGWTCYGYTNYAPAVQSLAKGYDKL